MRIGIVGQGFVGSAVYEGLKSFYEIKTYDLDPEKGNCTTLESLVNDVDVIFQCLPTPMKKTGECDTRIVEKSLSKIDRLCKNNFSTSGQKKIVIIKSTVLPGTTDSLNRKFKNVNIIFSPEFLTEANSFEDFKNQTRIILGGDQSSTTVVETMFRRVFPHTTIIKTDTNIAEMVKYFTNCFLASKVMFANEMYQISQELKINYDKVVEYSLHDDRIGKSHLSVPGPDGDLGFGGHCFPKDLNAMIYVAHTAGVDPIVLNAVNKKNNKVRKNRDWEMMKGRAVSEE